MLQLKKEYWTKFKQDGQLFEQLVGELLSLEYPGKTFHKTQATHDGSRDWELQLPLINGQNIDIWFECKYHQESLAAEDVSMTLVMAYVEDAKQIIFFSYSPVNREFAKKMSRFSERSRIPVFIYDDLELEALILRHWNQLNISDYFIKERPPLEKRSPEQLSVYCEVYQNGHLISCHKRSDFPVVHFNDILTIRITLFNHNSTDEQIATISLPPNVENNFMICNEAFMTSSQKVSVSVSHNSISYYSFHLKMKRFGPSVKLPSITIEWGKERKILYPGTVEGQWLAEAPIIGQVFHDIIFSQSQYMKKNSFTFSQITGRSGIGKSRLIHEIIAQAYILDKKVFYLDNDLKKSDFFRFVRKLVSHLAGLPELPSSKNIRFLGTDNDIHEISAQILYDNEYLSTLSGKELAAYLFMMMKEKKVWLALDNVQWMDEKSLELLENLLKYVGEPSGSGIFLAFNQDYLYSGTKADQLSKNILAYSAEYCQYVQSREVSGFTHEDAMNYLQECLTYKSTSYSDELVYTETLEKVIDYCGTQPFYLQNMLIYLYQKHVLERTDETSFYITSITDFWTHVQEVPKTVLALLERRIQLTTEHLAQRGVKQSFLELCQILSFCSTIPAILCRELFGEFPAKRELAELGILKIDSRGELSFYHQYFEQYFRQMYPLEQIPQQLLENFCGAVSRRHLKERMIEAYYLAQYVMGTCKNSLLERIMEKIVDWEISPRLSRLVNLAVSEQLIDLSELFSARLIASCYSSMCFMTANREGMQAACYYYERCYLDLLNDKKKYTAHRDLIFPLIREYLLSLGNLNRNQEAIDRANKLLPRVVSAAEYCTVREILCISNYALGQTAEAVCEVQSALSQDLAKEDEYKLIQEYGKAYYYDPNAYQYRELICKQWDEGFRLFNENWSDLTNSTDCSYLQREISAWCNSGIADLIRADIPTAESKMEYLSQYLDRTQMPYYEIKIRLFRALVLLMKDMADEAPGRFYKEICSLLNKAGDICVAYYNMQDYPLCFYLRASVQLYAGRYHEAVDSYKKTCVILQKNIDNPKEERIWSYFYEDMALRFVQLNVKFPQELLHGIHSAKLRKRVQELGNCNEPDEEIIRCNRSPILYGEGPWGLPKI